ncbi:protein RST1-like [Macadamia integrifolia]|uniref:protein RST1-like n=1 Tax=Macadamia integrifolia TaxID=60698 RepID=UPI001C4E8EA2|nr:protein RST1-like [Macadamia integrifolia]
MFSSKGYGFLFASDFRRTIRCGGWILRRLIPSSRSFDVELRFKRSSYRQVLLLIAQNKRTGLVEVCKFLRPFLNFSILRVSSSASSFSFTRLLGSSIASLSCSFPFEAMPVVKLMMECFKYFQRKVAEDMKNLIDVVNYLVDAFTVIFRQVVGTGSLIKEAQPWKLFYHFILIFTSFLVGVSPFSNCQIVYCSFRKSLGCRTYQNCYQ